MSKESHVKAAMKYDKENTKQVALKLNLKTDKDILDALGKSENVQGYIKKLIRTDFEIKKYKKELDNLYVVRDWLHEGGILNADLNYVVYFEEEECVDDLYEEYLKEENDNIDEESFIKKMCGDALKIAGIREDMINKALDWDNAETDDEFEDYVNKLISEKEQDFLTLVKNSVDSEEYYNSLDCDSDI